MGKAVSRDAVVLIAGLLARDTESLDQALRETERLWGEASHKSEAVGFSFTDYYEAEMGPCLRRQFIAFSCTVSSETLRDAKVRTNRIEERLSVAGRRTLNIDPGYLDLGTLVLASTKDATYRVYLGDGIYAQPMLYFEKGSFRPWPWTYPDYRTEGTILFFNTVRAHYKMGKIGRPVA
ncbi:MAG: DUF4416 family protein [Candidatus Aureabacteria bacterium]|nr:DUF4416 family protein [Candidatus Auribacterota bacterium]